MNELKTPVTIDEIVKAINDSAGTNVLDIDFDVIDSLLQQTGQSNVTNILSVSAARKIYDHILSGGKIDFVQTTSTGKSHITPNIVWADSGGAPQELWFGLSWIDELSSTFYKCKVDLYINTNNNRVILNAVTKASF